MVTLSLCAEQLGKQQETQMDDPKGFECLELHSLITRVDTHMDITRSPHGIAARTLSPVSADSTSASAHPTISTSLHGLYHKIGDPSQPPVSTSQLKVPSWIQVCGCFVLHLQNLPEYYVTCLPTPIPCPLPAPAVVAAIF